MSLTFAINAGSSSLKFQLIEMPEEKVIAKGLVERIGIDHSLLELEYNGETYEVREDIPNHERAVELLFEQLQEHNVIDNYDDITGVGHRVVNGGEDIKDSTLVTEELIERVEELSELAPLHNPPQAQVMRVFKDKLPKATMVAVFDTSFHTSLPAENYLYSIPTEYYEEYGVRKYGAHGTSHKYVAERAAEMLDRPLEELKLITCHLGNGASITAVENGQSVDTSMGFTPLAGITMGTRSGDIDVSILPYLMEKLNLTDVSDMIDILNKQSGVLGLSGVSSDMRDVEGAANEGNERAILALDIYVNRIQKYIGQYIATMNGVDGIVFTAGVGENSAYMRDRIIKGISWFGIELDSKANDTREEAIISSKDSKVAVLNIPTNEEIAIARDVERLK
ncbi:acetate/propionate family kinase [Dolosicoccus paucivorans]|uniref:Acetate kinase n=1 Tax=Dolosicoccus paucivorans TaxID=84521 RepID=A0A1G8PPE3_9LACT|nr:acetate kinase [Dolosicoccus paucivorans]PMC58160.1 acetate kinase [Dolosicoccus paucivorans]SDI94262.1 acetate kinase [Dolosicoccus paucivorans]